MGVRGWVRTPSVVIAFVLTAGVGAVWAESNRAQRPQRVDVPRISNDGAGSRGRHAPGLRGVNAIDRGYGRTFAGVDPSQLRRHHIRPGIIRAANYYSRRRK